LPPQLIPSFKLGAIGYLFTGAKGQKLTSAHIRHLIKKRVKLARINK
jgi:hypothetical protein